MEKLYRYECECGRGGNISGIFIAEEKDVKNATGKYVYFGEILGKHSEVSGTIESGEIFEVEVSESTLAELNSIFKDGNISGYNPLDYIQHECSRCGDRIRTYEDYYEIDEETICQDCATEEECEKYELI